MIKRPINRVNRIDVKVFQLGVVLLGTIRLHSKKMITMLLRFYVSFIKNCNHIFAAIALILIFSWTNNNDYKEQIKAERRAKYIKERAVQKQAQITSAYDQSTSNPHSLRESEIEVK